MYAAEKVSKFCLFLCGRVSCFGGIKDSAKGACFFGLRTEAGALPLYPTMASAALDPARVIDP